MSWQIWDGENLEQLPWRRQWNQKEGLGDKSLLDEKRSKTQVNLSNPRRETTCEVAGGFQSNRAWVNKFIF